MFVVIVVRVVTYLFLTCSVEFILFIMCGHGKLWNTHKKNSFSN